MYWEVMSKENKKNKKKEKAREKVIEASRFELTSLKIIAILTAISGLLSLVFEVRNLVSNTYTVYFIRLFSTVLSFIILVLSQSDFGKRNSNVLVHSLLTTIIASSAFVVYYLPDSFQINAIVIGLILVLVGLTIGWKIINQIFSVITYILLLSVTLFLNKTLFTQFSLISETLLAVVLLSIVSLIAAVAGAKNKKSVGANLSKKEKEGENDISESEKGLVKFLDMITYSSDGFFQISFDGKIIYANPAMVKLLGYSKKEDLLQLKAEEFYHNKEERSELQKLLERQKRVKNYKVTLKRKDGAVIIAKINARVITDDDDKQLIFEGSLQDITGQVRAEEEKKKMLEELRAERKSNVTKANSAQYTSNIKTQFLASMSHEIKTPINSIAGFLTLIEQGLFTSEEELRDFARNARVSADSLLDIINNILDISKIEAGKMELDEDDMSIKEEAQKAVSILNPTARAKDLNLRLELDDRIPETVIGDSTRFRQVLVNLLGNAVKYTEKGEAGIKLELFDVVNSKIRFRVTVFDTGRGIPREKLPLLFKPYSQVKDKKWARKEGTGLGLMICKELVNLMGGEINVDSEENAGTKVVFTVVMKKHEDTSIEEPKHHELHVPPTYSEPEVKEEIVEEVEIETTKPEEKEENPEEELQKKIEEEVEKEIQSEVTEEFYNVIDEEDNGKRRLLLVEDNPISQKVELKLLSESGYEVEAVDNGTDAINAVKSGRFHLVLMDIEMPDMDGLTATKMIRELDSPSKNVPIIAVTAHSSMKDREKCLASGMDDYIAKPININFMKMTIDQWLFRRY